MELAEAKASTVDRKRKTTENPDLSRPRDIPEDTGKEAAEALPIDWESCVEELKKLLDENHGLGVISFLRQHEDSSEDDEAKNANIQKFYTLPVISDKQIRRSIHQLIKTPTFLPIARADNADGAIRLWHKKFEADMPADTHWGDMNRNNSKNNGKGRATSRTSWPKDRPDFLRFVLYKENVDTATAAKDVVRMSRLNHFSNSLNYAGMKDKRGITAQFCSIYRVEKETLLAVNNGLAKSNNSVASGNSDGCGNTTMKGSNVLKLGNFEYISEEVKLGALSGNRFDIVLRNIDIGDVSVGYDKRQRVRQICESAGMALKSYGFVNYFGMQRFGKFHDTHLVGIAILKGDFEGAIDIIMREKPDEYPRITEARRQWTNRFDNIDVPNDENAARTAEMKVARNIQKELGRFLNCERSIVSSLAQKPRDYKRAFCSIAKNMRSLYLHSFQSYIFNLAATERIESGGSTEVRLGDLVLIEDKSLGVEGGGTSGLKGKVVKMVDGEDLITSKYSITDVVLPLVGSKILYPGGPLGNLFDQLLKRDGICKDDFAQIGAIDREISLSGDYRKLICRPADVIFKVILYEDPLQPLLQTDLMKINGVDVTATTICTSDGQDGQSEIILPQDSQVGNESTVLFGMTVGFVLPPSAYATIALRELTKRPTSSEYQSKLEVIGKCERNILAPISSTTPTTL